MRTLPPLRQLVRRLGALSVEGRLDVPVAGLTYDARRVMPGSVFFVMGNASESGGRPAIPCAVERGAAAIVSEDAGFLPYRAARIRVANCRRALAHAAAAFHDHPSRRLQLVVISGDASRLTVAHLLGECFRAAGIPTGILGTRGCWLGARWLPALDAQPEALDIQERLAALLRAGCRAGILELPPEAIEHGCVTACELERLILCQRTSHPANGAPQIAPDLSRNREAGFLLRGDAGGRNARSGVWYLEDALRGRATRNADLVFRLRGDDARPRTGRARRLRAGSGGTRLSLETAAGSMVVKLPLPGDRYARAALAAALLAAAGHLPPAAVLQGLSRARPLPGCLERVLIRPGGGLVWVDTCATAAELERSLEEVREFASGRLLLLFGCGWRQSVSERQARGRVAARLADDAVLTVDNPGREPAIHLLTEAAEAFTRERGCPPLVVDDRAAAIAALLARARAGDCVLLTRTDAAPTQELGDCVVPWDDREHARAALERANGEGRPRAPEEGT